MRKVTQNRLVVASHNEGKIREISALLRPYGMRDVVSGASFGIAEPVENGDSFVANAEIKSRYFAAHAGELSLADDSGLCVDILPDALGIHSGRYAEKPDGTRDFGWAMEKLRQELLEISGTDEGHSAYFSCALSLCWNDGIVANFEGRCAGILRFPASGECGFGYDPIFVPHGQAGSFAEPAIAKLKNSIGHRAKAFEKLVRAVF